ncbi:MAG: SDR family oxidoreductase [Alphaproteobacteria bacterium]|nr:SDR family oxidoreductase [Alphaproteobacteria bacterium]
MTRILVTGGAGFIGSFLCERLIEAGNEVVCADNFQTGSEANIQAIMGSRSFELIKHDVRVPLHVDVDEIYNFACPASPAQYQQHPTGTTKTAVLGAINMLDLARKVGAEILQASTSEVYGSSTIHPQPEEYWGNVNPIGARACYDEGKRCAEALFSDYRRQFGVATKVARIFNTYGPRMQPNDGRVVPSFIVQALTNKPITIFGDGTQIRSFCFVDDLVDGLIKLMKIQSAVAPINLGSPHECTIRVLAETVVELVGSRSPVEFRPLPSDDPPKRTPDISKARRLLDWSPAVSLTEGLGKTIRYFENVLSQRCGDNAQGRPSGAKKPFPDLSFSDD